MQNIEQMILSIAETRDRAMGVQFYLLAAYIESGARFGKVLELVPASWIRKLIPFFAQVKSSWTLQKILARLPGGSEGPSLCCPQYHMHYMVSVSLAFLRHCVFYDLAGRATFVIPKIYDVAAGTGVRVWPISEFVFQNAFWLVAYEVFIFLTLLTVAAVYIGGPGFVRFFKIPWISDCGLDFVAFASPKKGNCSALFPPCWPYCLMVGIRGRMAVRLVQWRLHGE